ncbi:unnamed protein product [Microthlaspi erraticum]|uniref:Uncharacterized protein n=1 Tax=Microthlaspi erraticum TaxID=1685480 RepID=A0A6D2JB38_9BRAS|nr:unnamed protein product [Microthlaspi erraticum]
MDRVAILENPRKWNSNTTFDLLILHTTSERSVDLVDITHNKWTEMIKQREALRTLPIAWFSALVLERVIGPVGMAKPPQVQAALLQVLPQLQLLHSISFLGQKLCFLNLLVHDRIRRPENWIELSSTSIGRSLFQTLMLFFTPLEAQIILPA